MPTLYTPRLSVVLSKATFDRMTDKIPWGMKTKIMVILLEDLLDMIDAHGNIVLAAILNRKIGAKDIVKDFRNLEDNDGTI